MDEDSVYVRCSLGIFQHGTAYSAAAIFTVLFLILSILHLIQMVTTRTWYLTALVIGAFFETIGYGARIGLAYQERNGDGCWSMGLYIASSVTILIAPALMAASIYMILGRIILLTEGESHAIIKKKWLTKLFVAGDVLSLLLQASGAGMLVEWTDIGNNIVIVGLFVQLVCFSLFIVVSVIFHRRMIARPTLKSLDRPVRWQRYLTTLYVVSSLILVRSIFRAIEYIQGWDGVLLSNEVYLYVFDAVPMFFALAWICYSHPSEIAILLRNEQPGARWLDTLKPGGRGKRDEAIGL